MYPNILHIHNMPFITTNFHEILSGSFSRPPPPKKNKTKQTSARKNVQSLEMLIKHLKRSINIHNLFVCGCTSHWIVFHPYGDVTIINERLQILTYTRHSWQLGSKGSLTCHTYCDTGHLFIMVISEDPWHSHLLLCAWQRSLHCMLDD